jgi:F0F1-type ATP synthase assembly protein I
MPEGEDPFKKVQEELRKIDLGDPAISDPAPEEAENESAVEERLAQLGEGVSSTELPPVPEWSYKRPEDKNKAKLAEAKKDDYKGLGYGLAIAYTLVGPLIVGWFAGMLIDKARGSGTLWQTWLTIGGMILGFIGAIVIISRSHQENQ